jgi:branched-chain amino acid transport system substrate-binding protein
MTSRSKVLLGIGAAALMAYACGGGASPPSTGSTIVFGAAVSLTGAQSEEGTLTKQGYDLWLDWVNTQGGITVNGVKHKVKIVYENDGSDPNQSAILVQKLISSEGAQFILGPYGSAATATDAVVVEKNQIPMVEANGAATAIFSHGYKYTFGVLSPAPEYEQGVIDMAAAQTPKPSTVAILSANDSFSVEVAKGVASEAAVKGMQVVFDQEYPAESTNLTSLVSQAKASNPDLLINSGHLAEAIAVNKAAKDVGLQAKLYAYSVGPTTPEFIKDLGPDANDVVTGSQWTADVKYKPAFYLTVPQYVHAYEQKYGADTPPDYHVAESTAACLAFQKAIEDAGSLDAKKVRDALANLDVMTFFGRIKFDSRGINTYKPMVVDQIQNGKHYTVWPADVANAKPIYPAPAWGSR